MAAQPELSKVKTKWTKFSTMYTNKFEINLELIGRQLIQMLKLDTAENVLEIACGSGRLAKVIREQYPHLEATYRGFDIAEPMAEMAGERNPTMTFSVGNAEDLQDIEDNSVDRYLSSLCMMITPNAENMLRECYRVLKPGGVAAVSIWGRRDVSTFFSAKNEAFAKQGIPPSEDRSNFHLYDNLEQFQQSVNSTGFVTSLQWDAAVALPFYNADDYIDFASFWFKGLEEKEAAVKQQVRDDVNGMMDNENLPILFDVRYLILFKPE